LVSIKNKNIIIVSHYYYENKNKTVVHSLKKKNNCIRYIKCQTHKVHCLAQDVTCHVRKKLPYISLRKMAQIYITSLVTRAKLREIKNFFDQMYRFYIMLS